MSRPLSIDLNADLGEGFPHDEALLTTVTSASLSCGSHAGDEATILRTLIAARERGVVVGAHPGYADRPHFGRRERMVAPEEVTDLILEQFQVLAALAGSERISLRFLKPHGALYNQAQREREVASGVVSAAVRLGLPILGQPGSLLAEHAKRAGIRFVAEGFPDRRYRSDGRLVARTEPDALLTGAGEVETQVVRLAEQGVETLCIHGDSPRAVEDAETVLAVLRRRGIQARSFA